MSKLNWEYSYDCPNCSNTITGEIPEGTDGDDHEEICKECGSRIAVTTFAELKIGVVADLIKGEPL